MTLDALIAGLYGRGPRAALAAYRLDRRVRARWSTDRDRGVVLAYAWGAWVGAPTPRLWRLLTRWGLPDDSVCLAESRIALGVADLASPGMVDAVVEVAGRFDHPIGEIARRRVLDAPETHDRLCLAAVTDATLGRFCLDHGLVPGSPVVRAVFTLAVGDPADYRAIDPDGSLLAVGYADAGPPLRARLRTAMLAAGDLDLVRVVAGTGRTRMTVTSPAEITFLADRLRAAGDWAALWDLIRDGSLCDALDRVDWFPPGWCPADRRGAELFAALAGATAEDRRLAGTPYDPLHAAAPEPIPGGPGIAYDGVNGVLCPADGPDRDEGFLPVAEEARFDPPGGTFRLSGLGFGLRRYLRVDRASGRIAVFGPVRDLPYLLGPTRLVLLDRHARTLATAQLPGTIGALVFLDPDTLLIHGNQPPAIRLRGQVPPDPTLPEGRALSLWRRDGTDLTLRRAVPVDLGPGDLSVAAPLGRVRIGRRWFGLDLAPIAAPRGAVADRPATTDNRLPVPPLRLPEAITARLDLPLARTGPGDLVAVAVALPTVTDPAATGVAELLHHWIEYRFGADVALGADDGLGDTEFAV